MKCVRLSFVLPALLVFALLAGPWGSTAAGGEVIRQGVLIPYEITAPEGWTYRSGPHRFVLGVFHPEGGGLYPNISLTLAGGPFQQKFTPEELVERNLFERPGARLLSSRWVSGENGDVLLAEFSWSSELGEVRALKAFFPLQKSVLVVSATSLTDEFADYEPLFQQSVMSVRIKEDPELAAKRRRGAAEPSDEGWLYGEE